MVGSRPVVSSPAARPSPTTSDILTYQNSSYGVRVQYPANWTIDEQDVDLNDTITNIVTLEHLHLQVGLISTQKTLT